MWSSPSLRKKIGETVYGIGWLPLGGYVKIAGMIDESMDKEQMAQPPQPWEFRSKPAWQRLIIMVGGVTVNLLLGFFIYAMILFTWGLDYVRPEGIPDGMTASSRDEKLRIKRWRCSNSRRWQTIRKRIRNQQLPLATQPETTNSEWQNWHLTSSICAR